MACVAIQGKGYASRKRANTFPWKTSKNIANVFHGVPEKMRFSCRVFRLEMNLWHRHREVSWDIWWSWWSGWSRIKTNKTKSLCTNSSKQSNKKTKKSNNKMYPSLAHLRIRCSTFLDASLGVVRLTRVDAALQSPSAKHLRFQCSHPWWQSPCRSGKGCRSHQSCTWGKDTKIGRKVSLHSWEGSCFDIVWKAAWFCLSNNRSFLSWVMLGNAG